MDLIFYYRSTSGTGIFNFRFFFVRLAVTDPLHGFGDILDDWHAFRDNPLWQTSSALAARGQLGQFFQGPFADFVGDAYDLFDSRQTPAEYLREALGGRTAGYKPGAPFGPYAVDQYTTNLTTGKKIFRHSAGRAGFYPPNRTFPQLITNTRITGGSTGGMARGALALRARMKRQAVKPAAQKARKGYSRTNVGLYRLTQPSNHKEKRFKDFSLASVALNLALTWYNIVDCFTVVAQGNAADERMGRRMILKDLMFRTRLVFQPAGAANCTCRVRLLLVWDHQCNGAAATIGEILNTAPVDNYSAFNNLANSRRFTIVSDRKVTLRSSANIGATQPAGTTATVDIYKKVDMPIQYAVGTTNGALSTHESNNFLLFGICDDVGTTVDLIAWRLRFYAD